MRQFTKYFTFTKIQILVLKLLAVILSNLKYVQKGMFGGAFFIFVAGNTQRF